MYIVEIENDNKKYEIYNDNLEDSDKKFESGAIVDEINKISSFSFKIYSNNVGFELLKEYKTKVRVYNTLTNKYDFLGRVLTLPDEMGDSGNITKSVTCESFLGYLHDSKQHYVEPKNWTLRGLVEHIINDHNEQVEDDKKFTIGAFEIEDDDDNLYLGIQRESTFKTLEDKIIDNVECEIGFREVDGKLYIDFYKKIGYHSTTKIEIAQNMKSINRDTAVGSIITRLIPLGAKIKETNDEGNEKETEQRIGIEAVNDNCEYIDDELALKTYGIIREYVEFDDVTEPSNLLKKGKEFLQKNNKLQITYDVKVVDISIINKDYDVLEVGNYHDVNNTLLDIEDNLRIIKKNTSIVNPSNSSVEMGNVYKTLSDIQSKRNDRIDNVENIIKDVTNNITNEAVKNLINKAYSVIQQNAESIYQEVAKQYISQSDFEMYKENVSTQFTQTNNSFQFDFNKLEQNITNVDNRVTENYNESNKYIRFEDGVVILGELNNPFLAKLSNVKLSFTQDGQEIAYISNNKLYITNAHVMYNLAIGEGEGSGYYDWIIRTNGNMSLKWRGQ